MLINLRAILISIVVTLLVTACTSYYEVTDPSSGKTYYTTEIEKSRDGSISFKDGATGRLVTIQNSEIGEVDSKTYKSNMPK